MTIGTPRQNQTSNTSLIYAYIDDNSNNGQISAGDNLVLSEYVTATTNVILFSTNVFYDNFTGTSLNRTYWTSVSGNIVASSGKVVLTGANTGTSMNTAGYYNMVPGETLIFSQANIPATSLSYPGLGTGGPRFQVGWDQGGNLINAIEGDGSYHSTGVSASAPTTLHEFKIIWNTNGKADYYIDGSKVYTGSIAFSTTSSPLSLGIYDASEVMWCSSVYCYPTTNSVSVQNTSLFTNSLLTLSRSVILATNLAQSYALASVNILNNSNEVVFTGEPDGQVFAWIATNSSNQLQRQLFSSQHSGKAWHAMAAVRTLEPGEGLAGLRVDPTNQSRCDVILWTSQTALPSLPQSSVVETAPNAAVIPITYPLGNTAVVTVRLWDNEANASTPFLQYQIFGNTNWQNATLIALDGVAYSPATRVAALPNGSSHALAWNAQADLGAGITTNILLRARAQDYAMVGSWSQPTPFTVNMSQDANTNGIPDWWEQKYFGQLVSAGFQLGKGNSFAGEELGGELLCLGLGAG